MFLSSNVLKSLTSYFVLLYAKRMKKDIKGFTLIELLVVIAVIAILSLAGIAVFTVIQNRLRTSATSATLEAVYKQIEQKRIANQTTLLNITGNGCSECSCRNGGGGYDLTSINSAGCLAVLNTTYVTKLGMQSVPYDGWGNPILMDENEFEGGTCGSKDHIWSFNGQGMWVPFFKCP